MHGRTVLFLLCLFVVVTLDLDFFFSFWPCFITSPVYALACFTPFSLNWKASWHDCFLGCLMGRTLSTDFVARFGFWGFRDLFGFFLYVILARIDMGGLQKGKYISGIPLSFLLGIRFGSATVWVEEREPKAKNDRNHCLITFVYILCAKFGFNVALLVQF